MRRKLPARSMTILTILGRTPPIFMYSVCLYCFDFFDITSNILTITFFIPTSNQTMQVLLYRFSLTRPHSFMYLLMMLLCEIYQVVCFISFRPVLFDRDNMMYCFTIFNPLLFKVTNYIQLTISIDCLFPNCLP